VKRVFIALALVLGCGREAPTTTPEPAPPTETDGEPDVGGFAFESTHRNDEPSADGSRDPASPAAESDNPAFAITTVEAARELAESAAEEHLDPKKQWKTSPVLPAAWPSKGAEAMFLMYPMAIHPQSMDRYELYSAQWVVVVGLEHGTTEVTKIGRTRRLGTVQDGRPTSLERRELDMAEKALMVHLIGGASQSGENRFWGYLKYFHEHPKIGADIKKRRPRFVKWLKSRPHHS